MSIFRKTNASRLTPWLCVTTVPLFAFSCVSHSAPQPPWEGCRAASKTEYESANLIKVESAVKVEPVGEFELKGIRRPLAAYNVVAAAS
jgi:hypothetical protein